MNLEYYKISPKINYPFSSIASDAWDEPDGAAGDGDEEATRDGGSGRAQRWAELSSCMERDVKLIQPLQLKA